MDNVELRVILSGDKDALRSLGDLQKVKDSLNKSEINLRLNAQGLRQQAASIKKEIDSLTKQRNDVVFGVSGVKDAEAALTRIRNLIRENQLAAQRQRDMGIDDTHTQAVISSLRDQETYWRRINEAVRHGAEGVRTYDEAIARAKESYAAIRGQIDSNNNSLKETATAQKIVNQAIREQSQHQKEAASLANTLNKARQQELQAAKEQAKTSREGRQETQQQMFASAQRIKLLQQEAEEARKAAKAYEDLQRIAAAGAPGRAIQSFGSALSSVGGVLQRMSGVLTHNNIIDTLERYATVMTARMFTQNWGAAFTRYDILSTYSRYLNMVGVSADDASASLDKLNAGIQGIPVGLSDVAYQTRMYQMYLDDMERATNLAIGLERALVAGGANEQMRTTARYEIDRLLSAGELSTSRQYRALMQGLGVSSRFLREEMGYGDLTNAEFVNQLFTKAISGDELIRGIEKLASSDRLNNAIELYRTTIESGLSNIQFALTRGKANILDALNESLEVGTGMNISGWLYEIRDAINEVYKSIAQWVRANPEKIAGFIDTLVGIFERIRGLDWERVIEGILEGFSDLIDIVEDVFDTLNKNDLFERFIVFSTVWAGPIGNALSTVSSALIIFGKAVEVVGTALAKLQLGQATGALGAITSFASAHPAIAAAAAAVAALGAAFAWEQNHKANLELISGKTVSDFKRQAESLNQSLADIRKGLSSFGDTNFDVALEKNQLTGFKSQLDRQISDIKDQAIAIETELNGLDRWLSSLTITDTLLNLFDVRDAIERVPLLEGQHEELLAQLEELMSLRREIIDKIGEYDSRDSSEPKVRNYAHGFEEEVEEVVQTAEEAEAAIEKLRDENQKLQDTYRKAMDDLFSGFGEYEAPEKVKFSTLEDNLEAHIQAFEKYRENMESIRRYLVVNPNEGLSAYVSELAKQGDAASIAAIAKRVAEQDFERLQTFGNEYQKHLDSMQLEQERATILDDLANFGIEGVLQRIANGDLTYGGSWESVLQEYIAEQERKLEEMQQAEEELLSGMASGVRNVELRDGTAADNLASSVIENYDMAKEQIQKHIEESGPLIEQLTGISTEDAEAQAQAAGESAAQIAKAIVDSINEAKAAIAGEDEEDTESFAGGFRMVQTIINAIVEESLPLLQETTTTTVSNILGVVLPAIEQVESRFIQAINAMIQALMRLMAAATQAANHLVREFARITAAINQAKAAVDALQAALNALVAQSYMISIGLTGPGAGMIGRMATGGLVNSNGKASYYDKGGSIFKPKGTDIVPAMLTPGEYVMRKKAVDAIGVHTLRNLNRLNIPAAIDGLMHRAYRPSIAGLMSYNNTINRYDNRSYSVNQNIQTNNPDYSYRIANRFAHAL